MSKPLTYNFNGEDHTMSAEEVEAIERLGPLAELIPIAHVPMLDAIAAMVNRPGIRWEEAAQVAVKRTPPIFHLWGMYTCGMSPHSALMEQQFKCRYKFHPDTCCERCAKRLHNAGRLVLHNAKERARFARLRKANYMRAREREKKEAAEAERRRLKSGLRELLKR